MNLYSFDHVWAGSLNKIMIFGKSAEPRGRKTNEIMQHTTVTDMRCPVLLNPARKLSYQFMAAEAHWILSGDDSTAGITPWNKNIGNFSDDGERFFGAYGPKIMNQLDYVIAKLKKDPDTRQAGLTIWRENPPETKDVPCTVAIFANIRDGKLNLGVFMRSSDLWLGLPYDIFNFSMLAHLICCHLNEDVHHEVLTGPVTLPGLLYVTAFSSHLYTSDLEKVEQCLASVVDYQPHTPVALSISKDSLMRTLRTLRNTSPGDSLRWWEAK